VSGFRCQVLGVRFQVSDSLDESDLSDESDILTSKQQPLKNNQQISKSANHPYDSHQLVPFWGNGG